MSQFRQIPVKVVNGHSILLGDVAHISDGFAQQTNIVRVNGDGVKTDPLQFSRSRVAPYACSRAGGEGSAPGHSSGCTGGIEFEDRFRSIGFRSRYDRQLVS